MNKFLETYKLSKLNHIDLMDILRTFHLKVEEYTHFSSAYGIISRIDNVLGHKKLSINLRRLKSYQAFPLTTMP